MGNAQTNELEGIRFVVDATGEKVAVQIDLKQYSELWEDFYDTILAQARSAEPRETLEAVRETLKQAGQLSA